LPSRNQDEALLLFNTIDLSVPAAAPFLDALMDEDKLGEIFAYVSLNLISISNLPVRAMLKHHRLAESRGRQSKM
jgi:hypothetical protein